MIVNCKSCNAEIEIDDELIEVYEELCEKHNTGIWCDDCVEGYEGTIQDRVYDEGVGK